MTGNDFDQRALHRVDRRIALADRSGNGCEDVVDRCIVQIDRVGLVEPMPQHIVEFRNRELRRLQWLERIEKRERRRRAVERFVGEDAQHSQQFRDRPPCRPGEEHMAMQLRQRRDRKHRIGRQRLRDQQAQIGVGQAQYGTNC